MSRIRKAVGFWAVLVALIVVPTTFYVVSRLLDNLLGLPPLLPGQGNLFLAAISLLVGVFWVSWSYSFLHYVGKGSPVEAFGVALYPTQNLVTSGPYAYSRNPMVLGMLFILLGIALLLNSISGVVLIPILALVAFVYIRLYEEPGLVRRFGEDYVQYRGTTPAIIPIWKPRPLAN